MKKLLALLLVLTLCVAIRYQYHVLREDDQTAAFLMRAHAAAGGLFVVQPDGSHQFVCSGTVFGFKPTGEALFLTARHCVTEEASVDFAGNVTPAHVSTARHEISFSANELGPYYEARLSLVSKTDDLAILELVNGDDLPNVPLGDEHLLAPDALLNNYSYPHSLGKVSLMLRYLAPSAAFSQRALAQQPTWSHAILVQGILVPGCSGSGLFDARQQGIIGVEVGTTGDGGIGFAIPTARVWALIHDPSTRESLPND